MIQIKTSGRNAPVPMLQSLSWFRRLAASPCFTSRVCVAVVTVNR